MHCKTRLIFHLTQRQTNSDIIHLPYNSPTWKYTSLVLSMLQSCTTNTTVLEYSQHSKKKQHTPFKSYHTQTPVLPSLVIKPLVYFLSLQIDLFSISHLNGTMRYAVFCNEHLSHSLVSLNLSMWQHVSFLPSSGHNNPDPCSPRALSL